MEYVQENLVIKRFKTGDIYSKIKLIDEGELVMSFTRRYYNADNQPRFTGKFRVQDIEELDEVYQETKAALVELERERTNEEKKS